MEFVLLLISFAVILAGALIFTNAVEWAGHRLSMGEGAVGSLLAAVGTAMPETLIPVIAIIGGSAGAEDVAVGAIIGAPFLLATLAMMLVGLAAYGYRNRRSQGNELNAHLPTTERDLIFFLVFFGLGLALGLGVPNWVQYVGAGLMLIAYGIYVKQTLAGGGDVQEEDTIAPLIVARPGVVTTNPDDPGRFAIGLQFAIGLGCIVGGAHMFVNELESVSETIGIAAIVLSLILAPLATELPEKVNSFFWVRDGKDSLALGNITGAMVFQSTIPISFGLIFTEWDLDKYGILSCALGLAGGLLALLVLARRGRFELPPIIGWGLLYAIFLTFVLVA
ncbi:MAG: sodium:calcium antiporter [Solirubrobacterales bacterium]